MKDKRVVLIFEGTWELYGSDLNRSSVLPFFEGMAKMHKHVEVIHTRFYDTRSFQAAFEALAGVAFKNAVVYVTGHGDGNRIGEAKILDIMARCSLESRESNITGVVLGSCFSAGTGRRPTDEIIKQLIQDSQLAWVSSYRCAGHWLEGTLVDLCLIQQLLFATEKHFQSEQGIANDLAKAMACFSPSSYFGNAETEDPMTLGDSLAFFAQARGQGRRARCITDSVWSAWKALQLIDETVDE